MTLKRSLVTATMVGGLAVAFSAFGTMVRIYNYPAITQVSFWICCIVTICISVALTFKRR